MSLVSFNNESPPTKVGFPSVRVSSLSHLIKQYLAFGRNPSSIKALDGLRGIAILLVLGRHATNPFVDGHEPILPIATWDAATPLINGWLGVDLFFVLSGFLIMYHLLKRKEGSLGQLDLRKYFLKRFLRIVPTYYVFLFTVVLGWIPFYNVSSEYVSLRVAWHMLFLQDYLGANIVVAFWSLGVEEKFYIFAPLFVLFFVGKQKPKTSLLIFLALFCFPLILRTITFLNNQDITTYQQFFPLFRSPAHLCFDSLMVGTMVAFLYWHKSEFCGLMANSRLAKVSFWFGTCIVSSFVFLTPLLANINWFKATALFSLVGIGFGGIVLAFVITPTLYKNVFESNLLFFFSKISYSLYLTHMVFIESTLEFLNQLTSFQTFSNGVQFLIYLPLYSCISILMALLLHYSVEKPFLIVKDRL